MYRVITRRKNIKNRRTRRKRGGGVLNFLRRCTGIGCTKIKHGNVVEPVAAPHLNPTNVKNNTGNFHNKIKHGNVVEPAAAPHLKPTNVKNNTGNFNSTIIPKILTFKSGPAIQSRLNKGYNIKHALIACHPRKVTKLGDHWIFRERVWGMLIEKIEPYDLLAIDTVDTDERGWQDITANIFDDEFIRRYKYKYNLVCIPDCGGEWADLQVQNPTFEDIWKFVHKALTLLYLLRYGGTICYSKFFEIDKVVDMETGDLVDYVNDDEPKFKSPYYSELKRQLESFKYPVSWTKDPTHITLIASLPTKSDD